MESKSVQTFSLLYFEDYFDYSKIYFFQNKLPIDTNMPNSPEYTAIVSNFKAII